jgi:hypothetical protein
MSKRKNREDDDFRYPHSKRPLIEEPTQESENGQNSLADESQVTISGRDSRASTPMLLGQRTQSFEPPPPNRQASGEGDSWSLGNTQSSGELNITSFLADDNLHPVRSVIGLRMAPCTNNESNYTRHAAHSSNEYDIDSQISEPNTTRYTTNLDVIPDHQPSLNLSNISTQNSNEYNVLSQYNESNPNFMVDSFPNRQPSEEFDPFNITQSNSTIATNTAETVITRYSPPFPPGDSSGNTQAYFLGIEDIYLPKNIYDKEFDKIQPNIESNIIDLDFSNALPMGLISIILYSYI